MIDELQDIHREIDKEVAKLRSCRPKKMSLREMWKRFKAIRFGSELGLRKKSDI